MRFTVQWVVSEKRKHSVIPIAFWLLSVCGGLTLLTYALHRRDPVYVTGELIGTLIYLRNLQFVLRARRRRPPATREGVCQTRSQQDDELKKSAREGL